MNERQYLVDDDLGERESWKKSDNKRQNEGNAFHLLILPSSHHHAFAFEAMRTEKTSS